MPAHATMNESDITRSLLCSRGPGRAQIIIMTKNTKGKLFLTLTQALLILVPLMFTTPARAFGYADPGTGAFVYQAAYAAFLGGTFYLRRLLNRFWRKRNRK